MLSERTARHRRGLSACLHGGVSAHCAATDTIVRTLTLMAVLMMLLAPGARAQLVTLESHDMPPRDLPLQYNLWEAERFAAERTDLAPDELRRELEKRGNTFTDDGLIHIEIVGPRGREALEHTFVESFGGVGDTRWRHRLDAWVPLDRLSEIARAVPDGYFLERASAGLPDDVLGEGPEAINSLSYRNGGAFGQGVTVGIIDSGYIGASEAEANGDLPGFGYVNYAWGGLETTTTHGTGCAEALYDHCPGVVMWLYRIDSLGDMGSAVDHAIDNGVDVLTHSISRYNQGWHDDSGDACAIANHAAQNDILFFTSAGNRAQQHWQGMYNPGSGDLMVHDWSTGDETIDMIVADGATINCYLSWNGEGIYLLDLLDSSLKRVAASAGYRFQEVEYENDTGSDQLMHLVVSAYPGTPMDAELEVFVHNRNAACTWQEHIVEGDSTTSPSNSTDSRVITVGAVDWNDFDSDPGAMGINMSYSSQGPSNGGMLLPDVAGPTNTTGFTYPTGFGGTSCATPNMAGAAAAFLSADTLMGAYPIWWLMAMQSQNWRDWGATGGDYLYGNGGAYLMDYVPDTIWVARAFGNTSDERSAPFYTLQAAHDHADVGDHVRVFDGGDYPEPALLTKELTVETILNPAIFGD